MKLCCKAIQSSAEKGDVIISESKQKDGTVVYSNLFGLRLKSGDIKFMLYCPWCGDCKL